jgi:hypothetical protein
MSKKLIAVASAAALALTGLVAVAPASAVGPFAVGVTQADTHSHANNDGSTADKELTMLVPSQDVLRYNPTNASFSSNTTGTLLRFKVTTPAGGEAVTATAAGGGAKLVTQAQVTKGDLTTASGTASISVTSDTNGEVSFYAYTTSTADSTVTVASGANSKVLYMKGISGKLNTYKLNFTASPLATAPGGKVTFTGTVTDMFGNIHKDIVTGDLNLSGLGGNLTAITKGDFAQNATTGVITFTAVNRDTVGSAAMSLVTDTSLTAVADGSPVKVAAFGDPIGTQFFSVSAVDLSAQVTALTAQVAALQAQLEASRPKATSVTKKRYNTLARKWNAANPGARVALKK